MKRKTTRKSTVISERFMHTVEEYLRQNKRLRRTLPIWGRLHIDRQLPFLCVYRRPHDQDDKGTERLVMGEASYLTASGDRRQRKSLSTLVSKIAATLTEEFGAFLIVEVWSAPQSQDDDHPAPLVPRPRFRIFARHSRIPSKIVEVLKSALSSIRIHKTQAEVEIVYGRKAGPPGMPVLLSTNDARALGCHVIGLEVESIYRHPETGEVFPLVRRALLRALTRALRRTFFEYARTQTTHRPPHYHALGRRAMVRAVWEVDRRLAEVSNEFDFLLQVTPVNASAAWATFRRKRFERPPTFYYRPLTIDPSLLRRELWDIPIEHLEDPTLGQLFREKRLELDTQIGMLDSLETPRFFYSSLQLFGRVDDALMGLAEEILEQVPPRSREGNRKTNLNATAFAERARAELAHYRQQYPDLPARVEIRDDTTGLMVSRGRLLVSRATNISAARAEALMQHEIGTHILTYYNGRAQPFCQLYSGLAGYDELQEGLAVFAEYLVGGLSRPRLRLLAGRVMAARRLVEGAAFIDTFRELSRDRNFDQRTAFTIAMRIYRGGGLTKDMVYLRGLVSLLAYLQGGGDLDPLFIGKIGVPHIPIIRELQLRKVLHPPPLRPRYMDLPTTAERLEKARSGISVLNLIERRSK